MAHPLLLLGAGGLAREASMFVEDAAWEGRRYELVGFVDDVEPDRTLLDRPVMSLAQAREHHPDAHVAATVGAPPLRRQLVEAALELGFAPAAPLVHPTALVYPGHVTLAEGVLVFQHVL